MLLSANEITVRCGTLAFWIGAVSDGAIEWSGGPDAESRGEYGLKAILLEMASNSVINEPESSLGAARYCLRHLVPFDHSMAPS